ncbi:putative protein phosphatase 2C 8-like protein [Trifolium pratense]|uniref:PPM-type phosphatase domain-containing protein n=1 Tax=Trifolium pratense TaxID=57577 RepID=A0A2K3P5R4_TRIPR|nr:putative protein phosphatase 2C 8-like protein [Trifolium pratense]
MNEFAETHKREADSENKEEIAASKKLRVESSEENASKELSFLIEADAAEDKGLRHSMEDEWVVLLDAARDFPGNLRCAHFAIYDGHGGRLAAEYAQKHLHGNVLAAGLPRELLDVKTAKRSILDGFRKTDESLLRESAEEYLLQGIFTSLHTDLGGGRTVLQLYVSGYWDKKICAVHFLDDFCFALGFGVISRDAKAVLARATLSDGSQDNSDGVPALKAIVLTREHKPIFPQERARIQKAGGVVSSNGRLQGRLEVSRAFGDRQFKKVGLVATPDIHSFDLTDRDHFIILGCDGLWGVFGPSDAVDFVQKLLNEGLPVTTVSRRLVREAVRERRCKDNCTAIIIAFKRN